jgi:hypothetical protein
MGDKYDPSQPLSFIPYQDMSNLFEAAMSQKLPIYLFI